MDDRTPTAEAANLEPSGRRQVIWLKRASLIFWAALIVRIGYIAVLPEGYYFSDFHNYEQAAISLLSGDGFGTDYQRPPLYPLFIAAHYSIFGQHFFPLRFTQSVAGALGSLLIFWIAKRLLGQRAGHIAGWISVFYPYYVFICGLLYPTILVTLLHLLALTALLKSQAGRHVIWTAAASLSLVLAALATPVSLAFLPFMLLWILAFSNFFPKRRILCTAIALCVVFLGLLPWTYYNYQRTGQITLVDARAREHLPYFTDQDSSATALKNAWQKRLPTITKNLDRFALRAAEEFLHFWTFVPDRTVTKSRDYRERAHQADKRIVVEHPFTSNWISVVSILTYGPIFILALAGLILNRSQWRRLSLIFFLLISQAAGYSFFFTQVRYRLPVEFCIMILAAGTLDYIWQIQQRKVRTA